MQMVAKAVLIVLVAASLPGAAHAKDIGHVIRLEQRISTNAQHRHRHRIETPRVTASDVQAQTAERSEPPPNAERLVRGDDLRGGAEGRKWGDGQAEPGVASQQR